MRKVHFTGKNCLILAALSFFASSCIPDSESPVIKELVIEKTVIDEVQPQGENLRKGEFYRYQEKFSNQIFQLPTDLGMMLPGTGVGNATFMGKSLSFINQVITSPTTTEGVAVTAVFSSELEALGLVGLEPEVHSVTVDKKGNAIFFSSGTNHAVSVSEDLTQFEAMVLIVGGTGNFEGASGEGKVTGFYNPKTGKGESSIIADLMFK